MIALVARWLPECALVFVTDSSFAVLDLLDWVSRLPHVSLITRLRMDAQLYDFAPERKPGQKGRPRSKGARRPAPKQRLADPKTKGEKLEIKHWYGGDQRQVEVYSETSLGYKTGHTPITIRWVLVRDPLDPFAPQAFLSTEVEPTPPQIRTWFVRRWRMEVTFEESRAHLGIETQRQWSDWAIARSTPVLFRLFSFVDALAWVRRCLWSSCHFQTSQSESDVGKIPRSLFARLTAAVC